MQSSQSLVAADSDRDSTESGVGRRSLAIRTFALEVWGLLGSGSVAAFAFGIADMDRAMSTAQGSIGFPALVAVLGLWVWFGQLIGVGLGLARWLTATFRRQVTSANVRHALCALCAAIATWVLARKVFSGSGVQRTHLSVYAPWVLSCCAAIASWVVPRAGAPALGGRIGRKALFFLQTASALGLAMLDAFTTVGYLYLHVLVITASVVLATNAIHSIGLPHRLKHCAVGVSLLTLPCLVSFPASQNARALLAQSTWAGVQLVEYIKFHFDFDHDGYSPVFGGGDCDDSDPSVFAGATERPGDGRDFNCDGLDDPKLPTLPFQRFRSANTLPAQAIYSRAKRFPTVVILVDALRFDRVGVSSFPNLAHLARESVLFTHVYSAAATTLSSVPAIMNGHVGAELGRENIAQALAQAGQTSNFIGPDAVIAHFGHLGAGNPILSFSSVQSIATNYSSGWGAGDTASTSAEITAAAIKQLDSSDPPALLWLHYYDVHQWNVLEDKDLAATRGDAARYDAALKRVDANLAPLLDRRDRLNLVVLSDHGEALGARGLRFHTSFAFQQLAHIPLLVRVPGTGAETVVTPVGSPGVFNLLRSLRGLEPDGTADQSPLLVLGESAPGNGPGFPSFDAAQWSLVYGNHRLLYMPHQQLVELYDVVQDPLENKNLADAEPHLASELLARLLELHNSP